MTEHLVEEVHTLLLWWYIDITRIYLYEPSTSSYVRLNALNVLHVHGPRFDAPLL